MLRVAARDAALSNPSLLGGRLLFEHATRCAQQLRIGARRVARAAATRGAARCAGAERTLLLSLPSTVRRDTGYEPGYTHAYNSASKCPNRPPGRAAAMRLGPTALGRARAYVTETGRAAARGSSPSRR